MGEINAKKLYNKHLNRNTPSGEYLSEKQLVDITYNSTIDALNELIDLIHSNDSNKFVVKTIVNSDEIETEDGGMAKIFMVDDPDIPQYDKGMFVKIQSWDESLNHEEFNQFINKKIKLTIEKIN